ncbi:TPM domain-containing protein [Ohtaekwangia koreensis]|uniref:Putative membrane protein n=1 Tax=Ohtaekwangia koreensis TaxID=688867 RepID=A0A1T5LFJ9_9BACT|nr:TPM domain-containing protein [Ohtaekwangia koreensis]SKC74806.1 putative membrane protein [Ohtaekwangia koreensis]
MNLKHKFSDSDLKRIQEAVKNAEDKISGEIVPVIVERSGHYSEGNYRGSLIGASLVFIFMIIFDRYVITDAENTLYYDPVFIFIIVILGGVVGAVLPNFIDPLKKMLVSQHHLDYSTRQRAENAFLQEEVFNTKHRTGIMIFISFFEHEVIVMADKGISKVVDQKQWDKIVSELITHIRAGKLVEGLEISIKRCGEILLEKGFYKTEDDTNELGDELRFDR